MRELLGEAITGDQNALFLKLRAGLVSVHRRSGDLWQAPEPLESENAITVFGACKALAAPSLPGDENSSFLVHVRSRLPRECRVEARALPEGEDVLVLVGNEVLDIPRSPVHALFGWLRAAVKRPFQRKSSPTSDVHAPPQVRLQALEESREIENSDGYAAACAMVAAAINERACGVVLESGSEGTHAQFDVDGILGPNRDVEESVLKAAINAFHNLCGFDPKRRGRQAARLTAFVENKPWTCSVILLRRSTCMRIDVGIEHSRRIKSLADTGMTEDVISRVQDCLKQESGLIIIAAPHRGGLSTLFDCIINSADRLLREFIVLEDAVAPRPEIQNVKTYRWDARTQKKPIDALASALRQYPGVLATCDITDATLAQQLVAEAADGKLVIIGLRGADACDGITRLIALGVDPKAVGRALIGAVGTRLVRKLCPKCKWEYLPRIDDLLQLRLDPNVDLTLSRASAAGCPVCTSTGYLGRTAVCELASGRTLRSHTVRNSQAAVLRKAAAKDGMVSVWRDAIGKVAAGVTSHEEIRRIFHRT